MDRSLLLAALGCAVVGIAALTALLIRERRAADRLRRRDERAQGELDRRDEELHHLVTTRLAELRDNLEDRPVTVSGPLFERELGGTAYAKDIEALLEQAGELVVHTKGRADQSAKVTLRSIMRSVQSLANEQQLAISTMQDRHDDPDVLEDLLRIDHMNAQLGRRAQAVAVLCGSWPGQQRAASPLTDVARGATSRIRDYLRVTVNGEVPLAVVSRAVEPVVLTVAELLDNATRHSQPSTSVEVGFKVAHNGVAIMIDDAGVAMNSDEIQDATRLLTSLQSTDIATLGDPPRIGFAVAGALAARYGFTVSVDTQSPFGGIRAVVFLPNTLLTSAYDETEAADGDDGTSGAEGSAGAASPEGAASAEDTHESEAPGGTAPPTGPRRPEAAPALAPSGLPRRRRAARASAASRRAGPGEPTGAAEPGERTEREAGRIAAGLAAWQRGGRSGRVAADSDSEGDSGS